MKIILFIFLLILVSCTHVPKGNFTKAEDARPLGTFSNAVLSAPDVTKTLTSKRLTEARSEPQNWLTYYGAYDGQRFSTLKEINKMTVKNLRPAWIFQFGQIGLAATPATYSFEAAPIIVDGVMFVSGWDGYVWAIDAENGRELWRYKHEIPLDTPLCCGNVNRGVAVANGKLFLATQNGYLVALNAVDGKEIWTRPFADVRAGESATLAPLIIRNLVIVGSSGAEYGVRGHIDAFDMDSGAAVWRRYNVPKPNEAGAESWPLTAKDEWSRGGGSAWVTGTYDPDLNLLYWGTGNPGPDFDGDIRPGNNLYTSSVVAIDPEDGSLKWHYQWTPHDVWDYDGVNENILFNKNGQKLLAHFDKNGFLFVLNRENGKLVHVSPFSKATWGDIDSNGKVIVKKVPSKEGTEICPGPAGAKEWTHAAYSPQTGLLYTPTIEACATYKLKPQKFLESLSYWGGDAKVSGHKQSGSVLAIDPLTGREKWSWKSKKPMLSSILATAGGLVFAGEPTGEFNAFDAETGKLLWQFQTGSGIHSSPVTFSIKNKQYIALPVGWGGWVEGFAPGMIGAPRGNALFVFAL